MKAEDGQYLLIANNAVHFAEKLTIHELITKNYTISRIGEVVPEVIEFVKHT